MNIDYKLIADNDPGGSLASAYAQMISATYETTPVKMMNYTNIANEISADVADALQEVVLVAAKPWVNQALMGEGLDVNHADVAGRLDALAGAGMAFDSAMAQQIKDAGKINVLSYPNLRIGQLETARQLRAEGKV